ncbi:unnamed protein product [Parajaminaea phylloscopi]
MTMQSPRMQVHLARGAQRASHWRAQSCQSSVVAGTADMKVIVTGASGLLGRAIFSHLQSQDHEVLGLANSRADGPLIKQDLLEQDSLRKRITDFAPDIVLHAAAERRPDVVEKDPERSHELNVEVPRRLAQLCGEIGARLIYISTDYVFDGSKPPYSVDSEPNPLNAYGTSKLLGERAVRDAGKEGMVTSLRVPVLYGPAEAPSESAVNVLATVIVPPQDGRMIKMDAYAVRYPTNVLDVARVLADTASLAVTESKPLPPILHFQATEAMTKYDMCNVMSRLQNRHAPPLAETSVSHLNPEYEIDPMAATARPRHCKLDMSALKEYGVDLGHVSFEDWWSSEMDTNARQETERLEVEKVQREEEERRRQAAEEEARRKEAELEAQRAKAAEEEAQRREAEEAQARQNELEEQKRRKEEEEEQLRQQQETKEAEATPDTDRAEILKAGKEDASTSTISEKPAEVGQKLDDASANPADTSEPTDVADTKAPDAGAGVSGPQPTVVSATSAAPAVAPSSPNPSFSSLRGRPTPPGTSEIRSPSSSQPTSLRNADGITPPLADAAPPTPSKRDDGKAPDSNGSQTVRANPFRKPWTEDRNGGMPERLATASLAPHPPDRVSTPVEADEDEAIYGVASPHPDRDGSGAAVRIIDRAFAQQQGEDGASSKDGAAVTAASDGAAQGLAGPANSVRAPSKPSQAQPSFTIRVGDPHKVGDGMTGHIVYTVRTKTDAAGFKAAQFSSLRRYSDFRWLHAALVHTNPGIIIPPVPEKVRGLISRFSPDLVEARRHGLENCINKIAHHPILSKDEDFKLFLESESFARDVKLRDARKGAVPTPEQKTWMGWSGTVGFNSGHKFHEFDDWFDSQKAYLDSLEAQLKQVVKSLNALGQSRKELADTIALSSHSLSMLSGSSLSRSLSASFVGLGDVQRRAQELEEIQSDSDIRHFGSVLYEYERIVGSVRKAFSTRVDTWHLMQKADEDLRKTRAKHEKLKREPAAGHYYEESLRDLAEAENRALERRASFDLVSKRCKEEMSRFDKQRVEDVRKAVDTWLTGQLNRREEILGEWIDYAQRCLQLDLRDDEQKARDAEIEAEKEAASRANAVDEAGEVRANGASAAVPSSSAPEAAHDTQAELVAGVSTGDNVDAEKGQPEDTDKQAEKSTQDEEAVAEATETAGSETQPAVAAAKPHEASNSAITQESTTASGDEAPEVTTKDDAIVPHPADPADATSDLNGAPTADDLSATKEPESGDVGSITAPSVQDDQITN